MHEWCVYDVETTTFFDGDPYYDENTLCLVGTNYPGHSQIYLPDTPIPVECDLLIGFNLKFDLHWRDRCNIPIQFRRVWDCQLVHYLLQHQKTVMPSLNEVLEYYKLPSKMDYIKELWDHGVDSRDISLDLFSEYLTVDLERTYEVFLRQYDEVLKRDKPFQNLVSLCNQDLLALCDMEENGMLYNEERSFELGYQAQERIDEIDKQIKDLLDFPHFKASSSEHKSASLYGGVARYDGKEVRQRVLKSGEVKCREVNCTLEQQLPKLIEPLENTQAAKEGYWSVAEPVLSTLIKKSNGTAKQLIVLYLERAKLAKFVDTYAWGLPKMIKEYKWKDSIIHGRYNQVVTGTGRLSSSKPNKQNLDGKIQECFITRF